MKKFKDYWWFYLVIGVCIAVFSFALFLRGEPQLSPEVICQQLPSIICMSIFFLSAIVVAGVVMYYLLPFLASKEVGTWLELRSNRLTERLRRRNTASIHPWLQQFLYYVLSQNNGTLSLPLGQDATCLTPRGQLADFRMEQVFYRFELVMAEKPDLDCAILCQVLQSYVWAELRNHGIPGLGSYFRDPTYGSILSVYVDRVVFDEGQHLLQFDLLYIDNPDAAKYAVQAHQRSKQTVQPEQEVYDDEVG